MTCGVNFLRCGVVWCGVVFSGVGFFVGLWVSVASFSSVSFEFVVDGGVGNG